jgi:hypothetical protein
MVNTAARQDTAVFATRHCHDIERIALVGDRKWEEWVARVCKPFTRAGRDGAVPGGAFEGKSVATVPSGG